MEAIGYDEEGKRLILVTYEPDARAAATAQADIQARLRDDMVLVVRPVGLDLSRIARTLIKKFGIGEISVSDLSKTESGEELTSALKDDPELLGNGIEVAGMVGASLSGQIINAIKQLSLLDFYIIDDKVSTVGLRDLAQYDVLELDRQFGVCGLPLYDFLPTEIDEAVTREDADQVRNILQRVGALQYFYPAPDSLALSLIDRGIHQYDVLTAATETSPLIGHPFGSNEYVEGERVTDVIESLSSKGFVVSGDLQMELTPEGKKIRQRIRYRPREGIVSKILRRFNLNVSVSASDIIPPLM
jgi:hypothetical protein